MLPFVWRGLLPLLGLLALLVYAMAPFARQVIEAQVQVGVRQALDTAGHSWAQASASGQHVSLSGVQPEPGAGERALQAARAALCPTWAGEKFCAVDVAGTFTEAAGRTEPSQPPVATARAEAPAADPAGVAPQAPAAAAVVVAQAAQQCEKSLATLLEDRRIEFARGSAELLAENEPLLDELAEAAKTCPGTVRIEGHTDSRGAIDMNRRLSQERAQAVQTALVARGLAPERLEAQGFGPVNPVGDNGTPEGRAQNRRIEFKVVMP